MKTKRVLLVLTVFALLIAGLSVAPAPETVNIPGAYLGQAAKEGLGRPTGESTRGDMGETAGPGAGGRGIEGPAGLGLTVNLGTLGASLSQASALDPQPGFTRGPVLTGGPGSRAFSTAGGTAELSPQVSGGGSWQNPLAQREGQGLPGEESQVQSIPVAGDLAGLTAIIQENFNRRVTQFQVGYVGNTDNLGEDMEGILAEVFQDEYLKYSVVFYQYGYSGYQDDVTIEFIVEYLTTLEQEGYVQQRVSEILGEIIWPGMTPLEQVKAVNDYIVLNTRYSTDTITSPHSPYTILAEGKGVCQGYALLAHKMLEESGVEVRIISGVAGGEDHGWNLVMIEGGWYHLDVTWNDPLPDRPGQVSYGYFLMGDVAISQTHSWEKGDYPAATRNDYAYFHAMRHATTLGDYIYFSHEGDNNYLYKGRVDGTGETRLNLNRSYYIAAWGNWVYYSNYSHGGYLFKTKADGSEETLLVQEHVTSLYIKEGYLYYTLENTGEEKSYALPQESRRLPSVVTGEVSGITAGSATAEGNITDPGEPRATRHGVCWNTTGMPTTSDSKAEGGPVSSPGTFSSQVTGLSPATAYYLRAYAVNDEGTAYGEEVTFETLPALETVTFPDANLEQAIRDELNKPTGDITRDDMEGIVELGANDRGIEDLTGLEYAVTLERLWIQDNQVSDLSPLSGLINLRELYIQNNLLDISEGSGTMKIIQEFIDNGVDVQYMPQREPAGLVKLT